MTLFLSRTSGRLPRLGWRVDGEMLLLVGFDQGREYVEPAPVRGSLPGAPQALDLAQHAIVVRLGANRVNLHTEPSLRQIL